MATTHDREIVTVLWLIAAFESRQANCADWATVMLFLMAVFSVARLALAKETERINR